jgi:hypothetical protein
VRVRMPVPDHALSVAKRHVAKSKRILDRPF